MKQLKTLLLTQLLVICITDATVDNHGGAGNFRPENRDSHSRAPTSLRQR